MGLTHAHVACHFAYILGELVRLWYLFTSTLLLAISRQSVLFGMATTLRCSTLTVFRVLARLFSFPVGPVALTN